MKQTENRQIDGLAGYCQRLEEIVSKRSAEFAIINKMLTMECREHRMTEDGLLLRATILDNTGEPVFLASKKGNFTYANEMATALYGYTREEFINLKLHHLLEPKDDVEILEQKRIREVSTAGQLEVQTVHRRKDGSLLPVHVRYRLIKTAHGGSIVVVVRDISNEMSLRGMLDHLPGIIWVTDADLKITSVMGAGLQTIGLESCPTSGLALPEFLEMNGMDRGAIDALRDGINSSTGCQALQFNVAGMNLKGWIVPFRNTAGELLGTTSFLMEVTGG